MRSDGQEGFIPSGFVYPAENILQNQDKTLGTIPLSNIVNSNSFPINANITTANGNILFSANTVNNNNNNNLPLASNSTQPPPAITDDLRYQTELVMLYDYKVCKLKKLLSIIRTIIILGTSSRRFIRT